MQPVQREKKDWSDLVGRKVDEAKKKTPTPHFPQDTHRWRTISIPVSLPHPQMPQITSLILPLSPLTGKKLDQNQGQRHPFFSSLFKALSECFLLSGRKDQADIRLTKPAVIGEGGGVLALTREGRRGGSTAHWKPAFQGIRSTQCTAPSLSCTGKFILCRLEKKPSLSPTKTHHTADI